MSTTLSSVLLYARRIVFFLTPFSLVLSINIGASNRQTFRSTDKTVIGVLQHLPEDYHSNSDKYPVVIFLHGFYERGVNSSDAELLSASIGDVDDIGIPRTIRKGAKFPFIVLSPQLKHRYEKWPDWYILEVIEWAKTTLRVDEKRIHITGLSLGGGGTFTALQEYPHVFASGAPVCPNWNDPSKAPAIAHEHVAVWAFHGGADDHVPLHTTTFMIDSINSSSAQGDQKAEVRIYEGARHAIWDRAYTNDHSEQTPNMYEWMMDIARARSGDNVLPNARAGDDQIINRSSSVTLSGSGDDPDGTVVEYKWTKLIGPAADIADAQNARTEVSFSRPGTYVFKLSVTDDGGAGDVDYVRVIVR